MSLKQCHQHGKHLWAAFAAFLPFVNMSTPQPLCPLTLQEDVIMAGVKRREAMTFPWEESLLGGCQVRQKVHIELRRGLCDHHTAKIMAAPLHVAQGKSSSFIQVGSTRLDNTGRRGQKSPGNTGSWSWKHEQIWQCLLISKYWNKMGPGANYMEIFLFAHFTARQSRV